MKQSWQVLFWRGMLVLLFLLALAGSLFWANGYQYDFIGNQLRRTGIIGISYSDNLAKVYLDGQKMEGTLPFVINNILPGRYQLVVGREGYWDYNLEVEVIADLISRVGSVFLYPLDPLSKSKPLLVWDDPGRRFLGMEGGYIWQNDGNQLKYAKLKNEIVAEDFVSAQGVEGKVIMIKVIGKWAFLETDQEKQYLLDLSSGESQLKRLPENYVWAGNFWLYFKGHSLAALDRQFSKAIWAKQPVDNQSITGVDYYSVGGREFLSLRLSPGDKQDGLYELKGEQIVPIDNGLVSSVLVAANNDLYYIKGQLEVWRFDSKKNLPVLLARFVDKVELSAVDITVNHSTDLLILKLNGKTFLADSTFQNVREMFPGLGVGQIMVNAPKTVYFVQTEPANDKGVERQLLYSLDLES